MTRVSAADAIAPLGDSLFGDSTSYYTGTTTFSITDIDLPGNSSLPVRLTRTHTASEAKGKLATGLLGEWELELPHLHGTFSKINGWQVGGPNPNNRCSSSPNDRNPPPASTTVNGQPSSVSMAGTDFWNGNFLSVPGQGDQLLLVRSASNALIPSDGQSYPWTTVNHWQIRCLPNLANPNTATNQVGEGFLALGPDGTKYSFDWMTKWPMDLIQRPKRFNNGSAGFTVYYQLLRNDVRIYATRVEDRFGNWVSYEYIGEQLQKIEANDGRKITFEYDPISKKLRFARAHGRTWEYIYAYGRLIKVVLPDASNWTYSTAPIIYVYSTDNIPTCTLADPVVSRISYFFTHPSGATGTFDFDPIRHSRFGARPGCTSDKGNIEQGLAQEFDTYTLARKTITGPGIASLQWKLDFAPQSTANTTKIANLTMPNGEKTRLTFGTEFFKNEGKLLKEEIIAADGAVLRTTDNEYAINPINPPYSFEVGEGILGVVPVTNVPVHQDDFDSTHVTPLQRRTITQQGKTFIEEYNFDQWARTVRTITSIPEILGVRYQTSYYKDDKNIWSLALPLKETDFVTDRHDINETYVLSELDYDANQTLPKRSRSIGRDWMALEYFADGTLRKLTDGLSKQTQLSSWKRGTPQTVTYADQKYTTEVIDDFGAVSSQTDELFNTTTIGRDSVGRINSIVHPSGDSVTWNSLDANFVQVPTAKFGLPANHWERTITVGTKTTRQYFDALLRPVLSEEFDANNENLTKTFITSTFDHAGRTTFQSYPVRSITSYNQTLSGIRTSYDALGRVTQTRQDSELGVLTSTNEYLSGFKKRVTNARGKQSTFEYQAFGEPSEEFPTKISLPESVVITIDRDVLGRTRSITRTGTGVNNAAVSATRSYLRDDLGRLCAVIEPESGATLTHYDLDSTVDWSAKVAALSASTCELSYPTVPNSAKIYQNYDDRKRLTSVSYGDGSTAGSILTYYDDGAPKTASSDGTEWAFFYNKRRMLERETLSVNSKSYSLVYGFDANANASSMTYPDGLQIDYAPNALGQPSKVGNFASALTYTASGSLNAFNYGNTLKHSMVQNTRLLPGRVTVKNAAGTTSILDTTLSFDENGNVLGLTDGVAGTNQSRGMTYDDLDRLHTVASNASTMFGNATYNYDGLDNITSLSIGAGLKARSYSYNYSQATQRLSDISNVSTGQTAFNLGYDERGNVTSRSGIGSTPVGFVFDRAERIRRFNSAAAGASENYTYDAKGRRALITKVSDASKKRYQLYSGAGQLVWEEDSDGLSKRHVYLGGTLLAREEMGGTPTAPLAPAALNYLSQNGAPLTENFRLSWTASATAAAPNAMQYTLQYCQLVQGQPCDGWESTQLYVGPALLWTPPASGLPFAGNMRFRVNACLAKLCSPWKYSSDQGVVPPLVTQVTVPATATTAFDISWPAVIGDATYSIERATASTGPWTALAGPITATLVSFAPPQSGTYYFRVKSQNAYGTRGFSPVSTGVVYSAPVNCMPGVPNDFVASNLVNGISTTGTFSLSWQQSCNTERYILTRDLNGVQDQVYTVLASQPLTLAQTGLGNASYQYRIQACAAPVKGSATFCSAFSAPLSVTVAIPNGLSAPQNFTGPASVNSGANFTLRWDAVSGSHHYRLTETDEFNPVVRVFDPIAGTSQVFSRPSRPTEPNTFTYYIYACPQTGPCSAPSTPVSVIVNCVGAACGMLVNRSASTTTYVHTDQLGSPIAETDVSGNVTARFRYEPFGQSLEANIAQGPSYTGHVADAASGLIYMQQRYYDPMIGRFLSTDPDPVGELGLNFNRYAYAGNNPYKYVDPDGRFFMLAIPAVEAIGTAISACAASGACLAVGAATVVATGVAVHNLSGGVKNGAFGHVQNSSSGGEAESDSSEDGPGFTDIDGNKPGFTGEAGSTVRGGTGSRTYDQDGYPKTDRDLPHPDEKGCGNGDHCHDWDRPEGGGKPSNKNRGMPRPPTPQDPPLPRGPNVPAPRK